MQHQSKYDSTLRTKRKKSRSRSRKRQTALLTVTSDIPDTGEDQERPDDRNKGNYPLERVALRDRRRKSFENATQVTVDETHIENPKISNKENTDGNTGNIRAQDSTVALETKVLTKQLPTTETKELGGEVQDIHEKAVHSTLQDYLRTPKRVQRLEVLRFLLHQDEGTCPLSKFTEGIGFVDSSMALQWIESMEGRRVCKLLEINVNNDPMVVTYVSHLDLCSAYNKSSVGCTNDRCFFIHICKQFLDGSCPKQLCEKSHVIACSRNVKALTMAGIEVLDAPEILQVVRLSLPKVCLSYNSEQGCTNVACCNFHICGEFVNGRCFRGLNDCNLEHSLSSHFNKALSVFYDKDADTLFNMMIFQRYQKLTAIPVADTIRMLPMILGIQKTSTKSSHIPASRNACRRRFTFQENSNDTTNGKPKEGTSSLPNTLPLTIPKYTSTNQWQDTAFPDYSQNSKMVQEPNTKFTPDHHSSSFFGEFDGNVIPIYQEFCCYDERIKVEEELQRRQQDSKLNSLGSRFFETKELAKNAAPETSTFAYAAAVGSQGKGIKFTEGTIKSRYVPTKSNSPGNIIQEKILNLLLQAPDGCYNLVDLHRQLQNDFDTTTDLLTWLNGSLGRRICAIRNAVTPHETTVILRISKLRLCFDYSTKSGCTEEECKFLHLCKPYIAEGCENEHCKYSHDVMSAQNQNVVKSSGLKFESDEDIRRAILFSHPRVCESYNSTKGCQNIACNRFHICANYVQKICPFENCKKGHHLQTPRNIRLLSSLGWEERLGFKMLLVTSSSVSAKIQGQLRSSYASGIDTIGISKITDFLLFLLNSHRDHVLLGELTVLDTFKDKSLQDILAWLKSREGRNLCKVFPASNPGKCLVKIGINSIQLCLKYLQPLGCQKEDCRSLHLCREYIGEFCLRIRCKYSHDVRDSHNKEIIRKTGLECFADQTVIKAIRLSLPQVCNEYNSATGCVGNSCTKFHICVEKVKHRCDSKQICSKSHDLSLPHNQRLLQIYETNENFMLLKLVVSRDNTVNQTERNFESLQNVCIDVVLPQVLREYNGCCSIEQFSAAFPVFLNIFESLYLLTRPKVQRFFIVLNCSEDQIVVAKGRFNLCFAYLTQEGCNNGHCSYLHLCKDLLLRHCTRQCRWSHNTEDNHNARVLKRTGIQQNIPNDLALTFIRNSLPTICQVHCSGAVCSDKLCRGFHICSNYVKKLCPLMPEKCAFGHSFLTTHNQTLLELFESSRILIKGRIVIPEGGQNSLQL